MSILNNIIDNYKTKTIGCFVGAAGCLLTLIAMFFYLGAPAEVAHVSVTLCFLGGVLGFIILSSFKQTSVFAPIVLMMGNLFALWCIILFPTQTLDWFSTEFFAGFSIGALFGLTPTVLVPLLSMIFGSILGIVATFLPQNKVVEVEAEQTA